ncbi:MAG: metal transporter [Thermoproteota archaeon]|nr:MAG: metal transporter [Candidatus Korarchaeota archaeon]
MHIPDGVLSAGVAASTYIVSAIAVALSSRRFFSEKLPGALSDPTGRVSLLSAVAAGVFAAQMLNWPIPGGTSAHLVGGALAALVLGPYGGCLAMALVLIVQCLVFGDGGITALGANVLNMGLVDVFAGYWIYKLVSKAVGGRRGMELGALLGGWIGITLAAAACGIEIGLSPKFGYPLSLTLSVMTMWHFALGIVEGVVTMLVFRYLLDKAPAVLGGVEVG